MSTRSFLRCTFCGAALLIAEAHVCLDGHERGSEPVIALAVYPGGPHEDTPAESPVDLELFAPQAVAAATTSYAAPPLRPLNSGSDDALLLFSRMERQRNASWLLSTTRPQATPWFVTS